MIGDLAQVIHEYYLISLDLTMIGDLAQVKIHFLDTDKTVLLRMK